MNTKIFALIVISTFCSIYGFSQDSDVNTNGIAENTPTINTIDREKMVNKANIILKKANKEINNRQYTDAQINLNKAIELDNSNSDAFAYRGFVKHNLNDMKGALEDYKKALTLNPEYAEVHYLKGITEFEMKDSENACKDWNLALELGMKESKDMVNEFCHRETPTTLLVR